MLGQTSGAVGDKIANIADKSSNIPSLKMPSCLASVQVIGPPCLPAKHTIEEDEHNLRKIDVECVQDFGILKKHPFLP